MCFQIVFLYVDDSVLITVVDVKPVSAGVPSNQIDMQWATSSSWGGAYMGYRSRHLVCAETLHVGIRVMHIVVYVHFFYESKN